MTAAPVITTLQYKGGTGKTVCSRLMAERMARWAVEDGMPMPLVIDADTSLGSAARHLQAFGAIRLQRPLHGFEGWEELGDLIASTPLDRPVLIDCPGGVYEGLRDHGESFLHALEMLGRPWTRVLPLNNMAVAVNTVGHIAGIRPLDQNTVVILNEHYGRNPQAFGLWHGTTDPITGHDQGGATRAALLASGGLELCLPALETSVMRNADNIKATFAEASDVMIRNSHVFAGATLRAWLVHAGAMVERVRSRLGY